MGAGDVLTGSDMDILFLMRDDCVSILQLVAGFNTHAGGGHRVEWAHMSCLFCKIVDGTIPAKLVHQDEDVIAFADINPQAPVHILIIPRKHIASLLFAGQLGGQSTALLGKLLAAAAQIAAEQGLHNGYRTVINTGSDGGQTVEHLHVHLLGGRAMHWPPG
jgi:histidine triad (HIT) family protein